MRTTTTTQVTINQAIPLYLVDHPSGRPGRSTAALTRVFGADAGPIERDIVDILRFAFAVGDRLAQHGSAVASAGVEQALREEYPVLTSPAISSVRDYWRQIAS